MLASGFMINADNLGDWFVYKYISPYKYGYEALIINEYDNLNGVDGDEADDYVDDKNFSESFSQACWAMVGLTIGLRVLAYFILRLVSRKV